MATDVPASQNCAVLLDQVSHRYQRRWALDGLSLQIEPGRVTGLIGKSGAGKTTAIKILLGFLQPTKGKSRILGHSPQRLYQRTPGVAAVLDRPALDPRLTVLQNLEYSLRLAARPADLLALLGRLELRALGRQRVAHLSAGEKQRVAIARALAMQAAVLILDEPFVHLDPANARVAMQAIQEQTANGAAVFLSSHNLAQVEALVDDVTCLHRGRILRQGPLSSILAEARSAAHVILNARPQAEVEQALARIPFVVDWRIEASDGGKVHHVVLDGDKSAELNAELHRRGLSVHELHLQRFNLDELFHRWPLEDGLER